MWILIIIVLLVVYFYKKSKPTKNTEQAQTTRAAEPVKQAEKQKKQYDAETEQLYQIAIKELKEYKKVFKPTPDCADSMRSYLNRPSRTRGDKKMYQQLKKTDIEYVKTMQKCVKEATKKLKKYKDLDPESKGTYIRQYMQSRLRSEIVSAARLRYRAPFYSYASDPLIKAIKQAELEGAITKIYHSHL